MLLWQPCWQPHTKTDPPVWLPASASLWPPEPSAGACRRRVCRGSHCLELSLGDFTIAMQVWLLTSYIVDGFAAAGTVLGSRLAALKATHPSGLGDLRRLCRRLFALGVATGALSGGLLLVFQVPLAKLATTDVESQQKLTGWVWPLVCAVQPINAGAHLSAPPLLSPFVMVAAEAHRQGVATGGRRAACQRRSTNATGTPLNSLFQPNVACFCNSRSRMLSRPGMMCLCLALAVSE